MGDFSANFKRPDSGINTVEGNVAGSRAAMLEKKRKKEQEEFEQRKLEISRKNKTTTIDGKFASGTTIYSSSTRSRSKKKAFLEQNPDEELEPAMKKKKTSKKEKKKKNQSQKELLSTLSFAGDEEEAALVEAALDDSSAPSKSKKDPAVDTSFLPDKARDLQVKQARAKLAKEWKAEQAKMQQEQLEITYSYWDGSGHRRSVVCQKGDSIGDFLELVRTKLAPEFKELGSVGADALLYVKEDLIIPQDLTFYDLIATKARGKSGPLFHFDVHEDVRVGAIDSRVEKDESHPGKVVERRWYDRNKHIFPASRWELYDPTQEYGSYTIGDFNKNKK
ncbi:XAP5 CIRCADIAN TIMEKEEPER [Seminavis robusta]|uniref:XAP5 CIRCADIAN TIMEKEEPER n=1 Tax=Seminavis robusta TaxID=568900 RepID=A0A9N8EJQ2_9STRA|nr:XAP5 CIRCADIAN TIMEKEEPER [Seminavis robusta]|eukprot:Sro1292_g260070.1 XAP5 CIRCADIAN TIMEKEEPER (335) ;mRNA; r:29694-30760